MKKIKSIELLKCGKCSHYLPHIFDNVEAEHRSFPANVLLINHIDLGYILYDTGYSDEIFKNGWKTTLYNRLMKPQIEDEDTIAFKLNERGISAKNIDRIILSHTHPDHIGGLKFFGECTIYTTLEVILTSHSRKIKDLVFNNMLQGRKVWEAIRDYADIWLSEYFECFDIFGDNSIIGVVLPGHAEGQLGLYVPEWNVLFGADACWGMDLLDKTMKKLPRMIQNNWEAYECTLNTLRQVHKEHPDLQMIFSHDKQEFSVFEEVK